MVLLSIAAAVVAASALSVLLALVMFVVGAYARMVLRSVRRGGREGTLWRVLSDDGRSPLPTSAGPAGWALLVRLADVRGAIRRSEPDLLANTRIRSSSFHRGIAKRASPFRRRLLPPASLRLRSPRASG